MSELLDENLRILIIDDSADIQKDFINILTTDYEDRNELDTLENKIFGPVNATKNTLLPKFQLTLVSQGQEGLEKIIQAINEGKPYALAFVDIRMPPGWNGIETIQHIWKYDSEIQVVICTAYSDYSWEETTTLLGSRENLLILKKPFDHVAVRQLSAALTKKWQMLHDVNKNTKKLEDHVNERTETLEKTLSITRGTLESTADGIMVIDDNNKLIDYNNKLIEMWKIPELILKKNNGETLFEYISTQLANTTDFINTIKFLNSHRNISKTETFKCKNNRVIELYSQPYSLHTKIIGRVWSFRDVSINALLEVKLRYQATHDYLTGLPNRLLLIDKVNERIATANRNQCSFGILFFDLDRFKLINDSLSHAVGDQVLQKIAQRTMRSIRKQDHCARLGGDEFVILANVESKNDLDSIAQKLLDIIAEPIEIENRILTITASIGISVYSVDGQEVDELLSNADLAMYRAKALGGNQIQYYTDALGKFSNERLVQEADLQQAIAKNEFFLEYQPQFDLTTEKIISIEALIRWKHPTKGVIPPSDFIPLAEETGLISVIGKWVLKTACQKNKQWQDAGLPKIRVAVNISSRQLREPNITKTILDILKETKLEAKYLELELTENIIINSKESLDSLNKLNEAGIYLTLDDFGTGYSCLNYLKNMPIQRIKIDQSFIKNMLTTTSDAAIVQAIIAMAKGLNLKVLAEGVENEKQLNVLKSSNCTELQGYFYSNPLDEVELVKFLKNYMK